MRLLLMGLVMLLCVASCLEGDKTSFLKAQEIPLASPRIEASSTLIDSSVSITVSLGMDNVSFHYTTDGSLPTMSSPKYIEPLHVTEPAVYNFRAFHKDWMPSEVSTLRLYEKGKTPDYFEWKSSSSKTYLGQGPGTVINQKKATRNFRNMEWVGLDNYVIAKVDFKEEVYIDQLTIGYLVDVNSWIFPPSSVTLYWSSTDSTEIRVPVVQKDEAIQLKDIEIPIRRSLNTVRIKVKNVSKLPEWHAGNGSKAWLFMDEWIFNEK